MILGVKIVPLEIWVILSLNRHSSQGVSLIENPPCVMFEGVRVYFLKKQVWQGLRLFLKVYQSLSRNTRNILEFRIMEMTYRLMLSLNLWLDHNRSHVKKIKKKYLPNSSSLLTRIYLMFSLEAFLSSCLQACRYISQFTLIYKFIVVYPLILFNTHLIICIIFDLTFTKYSKLVFLGVI